jgi:hypothetical protein
MKAQQEADAARERAKYEAQQAALKKKSDDDLAAYKERVASKISIDKKKDDE